MNTAHIISSLLAIAPSFLLAAAPIQAESPCIFTGRLMDAEHVAFDTNRVASLAAYDATSGKKIAAAKTFFRADSRRNYALRVPMASAPVDGAATPGAVVSVEVTEPNGAVWTGVVVDSDATLGGPGSVKEVDIVLAKCTNNEYGLDDDLYNDLYWAWRYSKYYKAGEAFDPTKDHDGDGVSTRSEALSGTNPFDPAVKLAIVAYKPEKPAPDSGSGEGENGELAFTASPGRAYSLEATTSLENPEWKMVEFLNEGSSDPVNYISLPATGGGKTPVVYLLPKRGKQAFYRVKVE
jgi:hypothetical protein